jgi:menaquinol-cytochrome c reductase cytochrome b/c subunit
MTEIPEHLRKRAEAARQKAAEKKAAEAGGDEAAPAEAAAEAEPAGGDAGKIPAHLLERSKAAKARKAEGPTESAEPGAVTAAAAAAVATAAPPPAATGPGGHTQRLLTVVKAGSIQDVKAVPQDKVHVWPHLLAAEFVAALAITVFTLLFSVFVNAPLLELANVNETPNPSKAPWYFLGLQELLTMFHPMVAGVTIPGMGIFLLILAPYMDRNPSNKPEDRKFAISLFTVQLMFWGVLVIIGSFFRGPGFNFVAPWTAGLFFEL